MARTRIVYITNRTTEPLDVMYDGAPDVIPPGYKVVSVDGKDEVVGNGPIINGQPTVLSFPSEYFAAEAYKRQHPLMGSQNPLSVDARDTEYLLGIEEWGDEVGHLEQSDSDELIDRSRLAKNRQNVVAVDIMEGARDVKGRKAKKVAAQARSKKKALAQANRRSAYTDPKLRNPAGLRIEGQLD